MIEVIVAIAVIGIIAVSFLTVMAMSFRWIVNSGNRTKAAYESQTAVDQQIAAQSTPGTGSLDLNVPGLGSSVPVNGTYYSQPVTVNGQTVTVIVFVPN